MFARTKRLTLRPAWPEETTPPVRWPCAIAQPPAIGRMDSDPDPRFVIVALDRAAPRLIGRIGLRTFGAGTAEFAAWLTPEERGRGYAEEAGHAVVAIAREALPLRRIAARARRDDAAALALLHRLGFEELEVSAADEVTAWLPVDREARLARGFTASVAARLPDRSYAATSG